MPMLTAETLRNSEVWRKQSAKASRDARRANRLANVHAVMWGIAIAAIIILRVILPFID